MLTCDSYTFVSFLFFVFVGADLIVVYGSLCWSVCQFAGLGVNEPGSGSEMVEGRRGDGRELPNSRGCAYWRL